MKPLVEFTARHPGTTGAAGVASALLTWSLNALHLVASVAADCAVILGLLATLLTVLLLAHRWRHRNDWHRPIRNYRPRHPDEDEDDQIPGL